jgi:hypothetical protein
MVGMDFQQVSEHILNSLIIPTRITLLIASMGAICGGIGFVIGNFKKGDNK